MYHALFLLLGSYIVLASCQHVLEFALSYRSHTITQTTAQLLSVPRLGALCAGDPELPAEQHLPVHPKFNRPSRSLMSRSVDMKGYTAQDNPESQYTRNDSINSVFVVGEKKKR